MLALVDAVSKGNPVQVVAHLTFVRRLVSVDS